jgi:ferrous iron transport protein B
MFSVFWLTIVGGGIISEYLERLATFITLDPCFKNPILHSAWTGLSLGMQTVLSFIGPLAILYTCLGLLEHSGYMQRAALVVDRFMQYLRLPGQSFVPIIVGLGCNVPAILSARTLSDPTDRLQTILMSPFMSCSARLAIFTVFAQAFFASHAHYAIFGLYLLGFGIAVFTGLAIRFVFKGAEFSPLIMQYVDYQFPDIQGILRTTFIRLQDFTLKAIQWIIPAIFCIHLCTRYHWGVPKAIFEPFMRIFAPMGLTLENWPAVLSLFSGLIAKEVLIGTLQGSYQSTGSEVLELTYYFHNAHAAMSYLIFVLLYFPCVSVTFAIAKETNLFWAMFSGIWSTSLAYCCAVLYYQWAQAEISLLALLGLTSLCLIYLLLIIMIVKYQMKADTKRSVPFRLKVSTSY